MKNNKTSVEDNNLSEIFKACGSNLLQAIELILINAMK